MAASDAQLFVVKQTALRVTLPVFDSSGALVTTGTTAVTISKDGGTFSNPNAGATNATQIATTSGVWLCDLDSTDTNCDTLVVKFTNGSNPVTVRVIETHTIPEPTSVPVFGAGGWSFLKWTGWIGARLRNKFTTTASTATLYRDDGTTVVATSTISESGGTLTRGEWS